VAYFAAVLTRSADRWEARDVDLDDIEDVAGLLEAMRETSEDEDFEPESAVLLLEQEDLWFAVIRTDVDEDPRVFVSDFTAASRSAYADLLFAAGLVPVGPDGRRLTSPDADLDEIAEIGAQDAPDAVGEEDEEDGDDGEDEDGRPAGEAGSRLDLDALGSLATAYPAVEVISQSRSSSPAAAVAGPAGDAELLTDFGVEAAVLVDLARDGLLPADALAELAEALGAADELEAVR
jgi:putative tRNA adenosine deaminase-associated protein